MTAAIAVRFALVVSFLPMISIGKDTHGPRREPKAAWQADWDKTVKAAEEERELVIYMTQAFEPVFARPFRKNIRKSK